MPQVRKVNTFAKITLLFGLLAMAKPVAANTFKAEDATQILNDSITLVDLRDRIAQAATDFSAPNFICLYNLEKASDKFQNQLFYLAGFMNISAEMKHKNDEAEANVYVHIQSSNILEYLKKNEDDIKQAEERCPGDNAIKEYIKEYHSLENKITPSLNEIKAKTEPK